MTQVGGKRGNKKARKGGPESWLPRAGSANGPTKFTEVKKVEAKAVRRRAAAGWPYGLVVNVRGRLLDDDETRDSTEQPEEKEEEIHDPPLLNVLEPCSRTVPSIDPAGWEGGKLSLVGGMHAACLPCVHPIQVMYDEHGIH